MTNKVKTIYIMVTKELKDFVIIDVSELDKIKYSEFLKKKYKLEDITCIYHADFINKSKFDFIDEVTLKSDSIVDAPLSLKEFLNQSKTKLGDDIYKESIEKFIDAIASLYRENYYVEDGFKSIVVKYSSAEKKLLNSYQKQSHLEDDFFNLYQAEYDKLNKKWSLFLDEKIDEFYTLIKSKKYPVRKRGIFSDNLSEFMANETLYIDSLRDVTEQWRNESRYLGSNLSVKCRHCGSDGVIQFTRMCGPGNARTFGGNNFNTELSREYLLKPEYGKKLVPGRKYYWRTILAMNGVCGKCNAKLLKMSDGMHGINEDGIFNISKFSGYDKCSIYPCDDFESWYEWCGLWMTIFNWFSYELGYSGVSGYGFFRKYEDEKLRRMLKKND